MGFRLWDPKARRIVRSHSVFFDENKMQTKPVKSMAAKRVVFQDSEPVQGVQAGGQAPQPQDIGEEVREDEQEVAQPVLRRSTRVSRPPDRYVPSLD